MTTTEGGFHLVSLPVMPLDPFFGVRKEPAPEDLAFGFAGPVKGKLLIRTRLAETKWENLLPVAEADANLPPGYETAKQLLDSGNADSYRARYKSFDDKFPPVVKSLAGLGRDAILDGEVVAVDASGRSSFQLLQNYHAVLDELLRAKPAAAKGKYVKAITTSSTMGPGVKIDPAVVREETAASA